MDFCEDYQIETVNPCGEQPLPKNGNCNLASINLSEFVDNPYTAHPSFNIKQFQKAVKLGIKYLDKIIDLNQDRHPLPQQKEMSLNYRNCGLGVFGYATALMKLGLKYGSKEAIQWTDTLFKFMFREAIFQSHALAKEKGHFPKYNKKLFDSNIIRLHDFSATTMEEFKKDGLRNCSLLSIAPTGSLATMLGESGGIEPEFALSFTRRTVGLTDNQDHYYKVYCKAAKEYMVLHPEITDESQLPDYFVSSENIDPMNRVKTQSVIQKHIDTAISSTINLPESATEDEMAKIYIYGWKNNLKGLTIFRNGCKRQAILTTDSQTTKDTKENITSQSHTYSRGEWKQIASDTIYYKRKIKIGCGKLSLFIGWSPSEHCIQELWVQRTGQGGCEKSIQSTVITMSGMLRLGGNIFNIEKALEGLGPCNSFVGQRAKGNKLSKGSSCATAILNEIKKFLEEIDGQQVTPPNLVQKEEVEKIISNVNVSEKNTQADISTYDMDRCPECGEPMRHEGGCRICSSCGYSHCG